MRITVYFNIGQWFWRVENAAGETIIASYENSLTRYETPEDAWHDAMYECRRKGLFG